MTALIHAFTRLGAAEHLTDDIRTVTAQAPTTFTALAHRERGAWGPTAAGDHSRAHPRPARGQ